MRIIVLVFLTLAMAFGIVRSGMPHANSTETPSEKCKRTKSTFNMSNRPRRRCGRSVISSERTTALEKIRSMLVDLRLAHRLPLKIWSCERKDDAWYDDNGVTVCYGFLDQIQKKAPERTTSGGVAPMDALIGPIVDAFRHEVGHAVFDVWKVPIPGQEETAADYSSAYLMLQFNKQETHRLLMVTAYQYLEYVRSKKQVTIPPTNTRHWRGASSITVAFFIDF